MLATLLKATWRRFVASEQLVNCNDNSSNCYEISPLFLVGGGFCIGTGMLWVVFAEMKNKNSALKISLLVVGVVATVAAVILVTRCQLAVCRLCADLWLARLTQFRDYFQVCEARTCCVGQGEGAQ